VARNRKRRNDRRPRRTSDEASARPGVATARGQRADGQRPEEVEETTGPSQDDAAESSQDDAPESRQDDVPESPQDDVPESLQDDAPESLQDDIPESLQHATPDVELAEAQLAVGRPKRGTPEEVSDEEFDDLEDDVTAMGEGEQPSTQLSSRAATSPAPRGVGRLVHFLQGSWRELQRVQWPDRRQVMQATGVVIGFVIVAGLFLGAADWVAQKLVTLILK
jgi:preprotein translocase subunit SecE